jgi:hypothetical protein
MRTGEFKEGSESHIVFISAGSERGQLGGSERNPPLGEHGRSKVPFGRGVDKQWTLWYHKWWYRKGLDASVDSRLNAGPTAPFEESTILRMTSIDLSSVLVVTVN